MDKMLFVNCGQSGGYLRRNFQRQFYLQPTGTFDEFRKRFALYELHRIEVILGGPAQVEDRGDIRVTNAGCRTRFTQKTKSRRTRRRDLAL